MRSLVTAIAAAALICCSNDQPEKKVLATDDTDETPIIMGVSPAAFACESVAPIEMVGGAIGQKVRLVDSPFDPPAGVPRPCNYRTTGDQPVQWSFDLDCRPAALDDGAKLMTKYATTPGATPVRVGESGLDHSNASLLFIDDDAPCYVRVLGPEADKRLALARLVAERLREENAPSGYRYQSTP